jgi:hypothetical protein
MDQFQSNLAEIIPWVNVIQVSSNKGPYPLQRRDNHYDAKIGWDSWRIGL